MTTTEIHPEGLNMMTETYNGWANRETWAFNLHWQNDHGLYLTTLDIAADYLTETYGDDWSELPEDEQRAAFYGVGEHVVSYWSDWVHNYDDHTGDPAMPRELAAFRDEVGSWWRVDVAETGAAVRESLGAES